MRFVPLLLFCSDQVVKNLLYVAKAIYLISPESDTMNPSEEQKGEEKETTDNMEENEGEEEEEEKKQELEEQQNENKPPSLLWVMKKLSLLAKREAADTPKVPLKVGVKSVFLFRLDFSEWYRWIAGRNVLWFEDLQLRDAR